MLVAFLAWALEGKPYAAPLTVTADTGRVGVAVEEGSAAPADNSEEELDKEYSEGERYDEEGIMEDDFPLGTWEEEEKDEDAPEAVPPEGSERPEGDDKKK
ncbi:MAG: hypothetical protein GY800_03085 [Planctomycetes bacterium]|nr:hypothetical protein [Planctomycetota bacterium]